MERIEPAHPEGNGFCGSIIGFVDLYVGGDPKLLLVPVGLRSCIVAQQDCNKLVEGVACKLSLDVGVMVGDAGVGFWGLGIDCLIMGDSGLIADTLALMLFSAGGSAQL